MERLVVHCLVCKELQDDIHEHLASGCLTDGTPAERAAAADQAQASARDWARNARVWDFEHICGLLPDRGCQVAMVEELLRLGFLIRNQPDLSEEAPSTSAGPSTSTAAVVPSGQRKKRSTGCLYGCKTILRVAKEDADRIRGDLELGRSISRRDKTVYRYYCEAVLVYNHVQVPMAVQNLTDADWVGRVTHRSRVVLRSHQKDAGNLNIALTLDEEFMLQTYFARIRHESLRPLEGSNKLFVSGSGQAVHSVSQDMYNFHAMYKLETSTSLDVRGAVRVAARRLTTQQQLTLDAYLGRCDAEVRDEDLVDAAELLHSLAVMPSDEGTPVVPQRRCFTEFLSAFPVSLQGQPPSKVQRTGCGFPGDRAYYDKWRLSQYDLRRAHLLGYFGTHRPSAGKVARLISAEGWSGNCPQPHEIVEAWKPPSRSRVETNPLIIRHVTEQSWTGVAIKDFGPPKGFGVVATQHYSKGDVVCDYHGRIITAAEGKAILSRLRDGAGYLFFFDSPSGKMCVDAQTFPCACHPGKDTYGRRINHSGKSSNLKPFRCELKLGDNASDVILFRATRDIPVDTELFFDYGVKRKSFRGEGLELEWLDD